MSTILGFGNLRLPRLSRGWVISGSLLIALCLVAPFFGWRLYERLTTNSVVAYFPEVKALYPGDKVQIMGIPVGAIDKIEPASDKMKVTFHYENKYKVPATASAVILNPTLVASRILQLEPPYNGGPVLTNNAVIAEDHTQVPVEWDELRNGITNIVSKLGPTPAQPKGPFGEVIESFADGLAGKGNQINSTLSGLSQALTALNEGRGDFFAVVRSLALFVNALHQDDKQFFALNTNLAEISNSFTKSDHDLDDLLVNADSLLTTTHKYLDENREVFAHDIDNLANFTTMLVQPTPRDGLESALHVGPTFASNVASMYSPAHGSFLGLPTIANFANPMQLICSAIQAGSRLGYQESAELCAQYLGPVLDAIKFNYLPFGANMFGSALALPKHVAYSEDRLRPPPGYKDTTVPGIFSPDTLLSHGNHEPGWIVAPGMQGAAVQEFTKNLLTPESLGELMGGPDIVPPAPQFSPMTLPGPPNAYDQNNPLPPPWYPQPLPSPTPAVPGVPAPEPPAIADAPVPARAGQ